MPHTIPDVQFRLYADVCECGLCMKKETDRKVSRPRNQQCRRKLAQNICRVDRKNEGIIQRRVAEIGGEAECSFSGSRQWILRGKRERHVNGIPTKSTRGAAKRTDGSGPGQFHLLQPCDRLRREYAARRTPIDPNSGGRIGSQEFSIYRSDVFTCGWEFVLGTLSIGNGDHRDLADIGNRDRFLLSAGSLTPKERAAVQVDQYAFLIPPCDAT